MPTIQEAVAAAQPGDTVTIPAGVYNVSDLVLPEGITLQANGDATVVGNLIASSNTTIQGFTFEGGTVDLSNSSGVTVANSVFNGGATSILVDSADGARIEGNDFNNVAGNVISGWRLNESTISNNDFVNTRQSINLNFDNDTSRGNNITIEGNYFTGNTRMPLEIHHGGSPGGSYTANLTVRDNWVENLSDSSGEGFQTDVAYSIISTNGVNTLITGNYAGGSGNAIGIELAGSGEITGNYIEGFEFGSIVYGDGFNVHDNAFVGATVNDVLNYAGGSGAIQNNAPADNGLLAQLQANYAAAETTPTDTAGTNDAGGTNDADGTNDTGQTTDPGTSETEVAPTADAVQDAIASAQPGDTITIPAGVYHVSDLVLPEGFTLQANGDATIVGNLIASSNTTIQGFTFKGGTVDLSNTDGVTVADSVFNGGTTSIAIDGANGAHISDNDFHNVSGGVISGWGLNQSTISGNNFVDCWQPVDLSFNNDPSRGHDITIEENYFSGTIRKPIEIGPTGAYTSNLVVRDNWSENMNNGGPEGGYETDVAYSIISTNGTNTLITGNYAGGSGNSVGIEMDGSGEITGNYVEGFDFGTIVYGDGFNVHDNAIVGATFDDVLNYAGKTGTIQDNATQDNGLLAQLKANDTAAEVDSATGVFASNQPFDFSGILQHQPDQIG